MMALGIFSILVHCVIGFLPLVTTTTTTPAPSCTMDVFDKCFPDSPSTRDLINTAESMVVRLTVKQVKSLCKPTLDETKKCIETVQGPCKEDPSEDMKRLMASVKAINILCDAKDMEVYETSYGCVTTDNSTKAVDNCVDVMKDEVRGTLRNDDACKVVNECLMCVEDTLYDHCGEEASDVYSRLSQSLLSQLGDQLRECTVSEASSLSYHLAFWTSAITILLLIN